MTRYRRPTWLIAIVLIAALIRGCVALQRSQDDGDREEQIRQGQEIIADLGRSCVASGGMWNRFRMECVPLPPGTPVRRASPPAAALAAATRAGGLGATPLASPAITQSDAAMFRGDAGRTGFQPGSGPAVAPVAGWQVPLGQAGDDIYGAPVVAGGLVYAGGPRNVLLAVDAATGAERWRFQTGGPIRATPAVVDGILYLACADHNVYALDAATGAEIWRTTLLDDVDTSPAVADGLVYVAGDDGYVRALDALTGSQRWFYVAPWPFFAPSAGAGGVYLVLEDRLIALDAENGTLRWEYPMERPNRVPPAVAGGLVYAGGNGDLVALDAATGEEWWRFDPESPVRGAPAVAGGVLYAATDAGMIYALDAVSGAERWHGQPEFLYTPTSPVVAGDALYVAADLGGTLVALDAATGAERWRYAARAISSTSEPAVGDGALYVVQTAYEPRVYSPVLYALVPPSAATPAPAATP